MLAVIAVPACAQSGSDGVYGGYVGSRRQFHMEMQSARRRAALGHALKRANAAVPSGARVAVHVSFPPAQRGLANIEMLSLEPEDTGAHSAQSLAILDRRAHAIDASFNANKDVRPGHAYRVVLEDARGDKYPVGEIRVRKSAERFALAALLLGASQRSSRMQRQARERSAAPRTSPYTPPAPGAGFAAPQTGPGFIAPRSR